MTFDCSDGTDGEAMLAVEAKTLVFGADGGQSVPVGTQDMDNAVLDAGLAFQAFLFIYTNHSCIPLGLPTSAMKASARC